MKRGIPAILTILVIAALASAGGRGWPPPEVRAVAEFEQAAKDAEAAYQEDLLGSFKVLDGGLLAEERAAVKRREFEEANRIRLVRDRSSRLATEISRHDYLGGKIGAEKVTLAADSANQVLTGHAKELAVAAKSYAVALGEAQEAAQPLLMVARDIAVRSGDLDAANRVQAAEDRIGHEIRERSRSLIYREFRFTDLSALEDKFLIDLTTHPVAWRVTDGELVGMEGGGEKIEATLGIDFESISAVTVTGRIIAPFRHNLRLTVGPVNAIFNWERGVECHFRYFEQLTVHRVNLLVPGREHEIAVRQLTRKSIELTVDGKRAWITQGTLDGTITAYPSQSAIGLREIRVLGVPTKHVWPDHPTHRRW